MDEINRQILHELSVEGRLPNTELADRVGLSPSACLRRVQDLERTGVISGYRATINQEVLGNGFVVYVMVGLSEHGKAAQDVFEHAVAGFEQVTECHNVTGSFEYILRVEVPSLEAYKRFHSDQLGTVSEVRTIVSHVVMGSSKDGRS